MGTPVGAADQSQAPTIDRNTLLAFDLETTGPNPHTALIVTSALVDIKQGQVRTREWLANPGVDIPTEATAVHGISTEQAREHGRPHQEVVAETLEGIANGWSQGRTLVVFNAAFDLTILKRLAPNFTVRGPILDPYVIDRGLDPYRKGKRTLGALCEHHGVRLDTAHDAGADAIAAARLAWKMLGEHAQLAEANWREVNSLQSRWHAERQRSFAEYLAQQGKDASEVNADWPIAGAPWQ